ncbi:MAG: tetratricopeptide repeat protein [Deltaproteobacteria bacterium]|jgi:tetratricopeptide (TPR) repeat protein|nr:tetratricopeptide repeat protein [Deltaproteobacteria bacterium]
MSTHIDYEINKELGECYLFMGDFDKAGTYYQKAAAAAPDQADAYLGLATVAVQKGDLDLAAANYILASERKESDRPLAGLGLIAMERGRHEDAFAHFKQALNLNPGNMVAINGLVQEGYFLDLLDDIIPYLRAALTEGETEPVRYTLAGCLTVLGRDEEARQELETLLGANPNNQSARELYARIAA